MATEKPLQPLCTAVDNLVVVSSAQKQASAARWAENRARGVRAGFSTIGWKFGETRTFKRPDWFFDENGDMPKEVSLTLVRPQIFAELGDRELYEKLMARVREHELEIQREMRAEGRFMWLRKLAKQRRDRAAQSFEERFGITPKYAGSSKWVVLAELQRDREWVRQYAEARERMLRGEAAVFPAGTYWLRRFAGVAVAAQGP